MKVRNDNVLVRLQFRGMGSPVAVNVPCHVQLYLDTYAQRSVSPDGTIIYHHPAFPLRQEPVESNAVSGRA